MAPIHATNDATGKYEYNKNVIKHKINRRGNKQDTRRMKENKEEEGAEDEEQGKKRNIRVAEFSQV